MTEFEYYLRVLRAGDQYRDEYGKFLEIGGFSFYKVGLEVGAILDRFRALTGGTCSAEFRDGDLLHRVAYNEIYKVRSYGHYVRVGYAGSDEFSAGFDLLYDELTK